MRELLKTERFYRNLSDVQKAELAQSMRLTSSWLRKRMAMPQLLQMYQIVQIVEYSKGTEIPLEVEDFNETL